MCICHRELEIHQQHERQSEGLNGEGGGGGGGAVLTPVSPCCTVCTDSAHMYSILRLHYTLHKPRGIPRGGGVQGVLMPPPPHRISPRTAPA